MSTADAPYVGVVSYIEPGIEELSSNTVNRRAAGVFDAVDVSMLVNEAVSFDVRLDASPPELVVVTVEPDVVLPVRKLELGSITVPDEVLIFALVVITEWPLRTEAGRVERLGDLCSCRMDDEVWAASRSGPSEKAHPSESKDVVEEPEYVPTPDQSPKHDQYLSTLTTA